jgi:hypothetical protein
MNETSTDALKTNPLPASRGAVTGLAALSAVFTLPSSIDAAVVYSGIQNIGATLPPAIRHASNGSAGFGSIAVPLNLDGDAAADFGLQARQSLNGGFRFGLGKVLPLGNLVEGGEGGAFNLRTSNIVPGPSSLNTGLLRSVGQVGAGPKVPFGYFANGVPGIVGVAFQQGGQTHFGWIRLRVDDGPQGFPYQVTAIDWLYESAPNTPIHVPEANPGMVLLAAGGTGLAAWRLRQRKASKAGSVTPA